MRLSVLVAVGMCVWACTALPQRSPDEWVTVTMTGDESNITDLDILDATHELAARSPKKPSLSICQTKEKSTFHCYGDWAQPRETCGLTDHCNAYFWPYRFQGEICVADGDKWNIGLCCWVGVKRSCGGKPPKSVHMWEPTPTIKPSPTPTTPGTDPVTTGIVIGTNEPITLPVSEPSEVV